MATLTVGTSQQFSTIAAAVAASSSGDIINVDAGTYINDSVTIRKNLAFNEVGGTVVMVATVPSPDGKAIIIEGGTLALDGVNIHGNENGLLAASDPAGSTVTGAVVGHQIKSRAASTTITGSLIADGGGGTASYEIDLPNRGVAVVEGNVIQKDEGSENPIAITFGEEGNAYASSSLLVQGNTIVNNETDRATTAISTDALATTTGNSLYGWTAVSEGSASVSGNTTLTTEPALAGLAGQRGGQPGRRGDQHRRGHRRGYDHKHCAGLGGHSGVSIAAVQLHGP